jgi:hypothetical protein
VRLGAPTLRFQAFSASVSCGLLLAGRKERPTGSPQPLLVSLRQSSSEPVPQPAPVFATSNATANHAETAASGGPRRLQKPCSHDRQPLQNCETHHRRRDRCVKKQAKPPRKQSGRSSCPSLALGAQPSAKKQRRKILGTTPPVAVTSRETGQMGNVELNHCRLALWQFIYQVTKNSSAMLRLPNALALNPSSISPKWSPEIPRTKARGAV